MPDLEARAINQDSCERWYLCHEYCRKWSPGFDQRMAVRDAMRREMREIVVAEGDRHKVTHGLWRMADNPDKLKVSSFRPPFGYDKHFDVESVLRLGEEVGAISLCFHFPNGPKSMKPSPSYMSRSFLRRVLE